MAYFSKSAMQLINAAHGEKMTDWGGHKYSDSHDTSGEDKWMPMVDSSEHGENMHPRAYSGDLNHMDKEAAKGVVRRAKGGPIAKKCAMGMKYKADGGDMEKSAKRGGHMKRKADGGDVDPEPENKAKRGGAVKKKADGGAMQKDCHGGRLKKSGGGLNALFNGIDNQFIQPANAGVNKVLAEQQAMGPMSGLE